MTPKSRRAIAKATVVVGAILVAIGFSEAGARLVLNPADYLSVTVHSDDVLGIKIAPHSAGFDAWGFRNPGVPSSAEIVTLGDSHTFGNTAAMRDAWPSAVARKLGRTVYNLGVGGYGPNQYYHLLTTRAIPLRPRWVFCGLYMGDDFENAFSITYGLDHWAYLRSGEWGVVNASIWGDVERQGPLKPLRDWLSRNSIVYRLVVHGAVFGAVKNAWRFGQIESNHDPAVTMLRVPDNDLLEAFRPVGLANRLEQGRREVKEGMRITFHLLKEMDRVCRANGCTFVVVAIPTKETVFAEYLQRAPQLHLKDNVDRLISSERRARSELTAFLDRTGIAYVDTLPALRQAVGQKLYARTTADMHPGKNGYRVIADAVVEFIEQAGARD